VTSAVILTEDDRVPLGPAVGRRIAYQKPFVDDTTLRFGIFWPFARTDFPSRVLEERNPHITDIDSHIDLARAVESVGLDMILVPDVYASAVTSDAVGAEYLDPSTHGIVSAVPLILATSRIGIVSTIHTTFFHPVQIARFGGHLAHLSGGRWGWNIVVGRTDTDSSLFGFTEAVDRDSRYDLADECVELIEAIWASPVGFDFAGRQFNVKGKLRGPFPPTRPMLVSAAASDRGHVFAVEHCDYLFTAATSPDHAVQLHTEMVDRATGIGRKPPALAVIAMVLIRNTPGEAERAIAEIVDGIDADREGQVNEERLAKTRGMLTDYPALIGTADEVAGKLIDLHRTGVRGVVLRLPYWIPEEAARLAPVFDRLQAAGVWTPPAERAYSW